MATFLRIVIGLLLIAHGLVHLLYLTDDVQEFSLEDSWIVPDSAGRSVGLLLIWATVVAFFLVGLAVWGVPGLSSIWPALAIGGSLLSLALMVAFWSWSLIFGVLIDVALIAIAVIRPEWTDQIGG